MEKQVIMYLKDGRSARYSIDVLSMIAGDRDVDTVIDAETGVVIYSAAESYIDPNYSAYFNAPAPDLLTLFRSAVNI